MSKSAMIRRLARLSTIAIFMRSPPAACATLAMRSFATAAHLGGVMRMRGGAEEVTQLRTTSFEATWRRLSAGTLQDEPIARSSHEISLVGGSVLLFGGGIATGIGLKSDQTAKVVEQQTALIGELQDGQRQLVEAASKPIVLDAELRASLASTPEAPGVQEACSDLADRGTARKSSSCSMCGHNVMREMHAVAEPLMRTYIVYMMPILAPVHTV